MLYIMAKSCHSFFNYKKLAVLLTCDNFKKILRKIVCLIEITFI